MTEPLLTPQAEEEISLLQVGALLLRGRRVIAGALVVGGVLGGAFGLTTVPTFKASASFMAREASSGSGGLASLAGQFGVRVPGSDGGDSPEFYQELLTSREVLSTVLGSTFDPDGEAGTLPPAPLLELAEIDGRTEGERVERGVEWLREGVLSTSVGRQTGVVSLSVTTRWPSVSQSIVATLLDAMQQFNLETRQSQAQAERVFLESRVKAARDELTQAEGKLQAFLQQNRQFENSPELQFEYDRLQRDVTMRQEVYTGLVQAYEEAKIREVRDTPAVTVIEHPVLPAQREPRGTVLKGLLGLILGGLVGLGVVVGREMLADEPASDSAEFRKAWAETKKDLSRLRPRRRAH